MNIKDLKQQEIEQVSGGVLAIRSVALNTSFDRAVAAAPTNIKASIDLVAACCCSCHCCSSCSNLNIGSIKTLSIGL